MQTEATPRGKRIQRCGAVMPYAIAALILLLTFAVLVIDFARVSLVRSQLATAVDAASLAAAGGLPVSPSEARNRAKLAAKNNIVNGKALILQDSDVQFGRWDATAGQFVLLTGAAEADATAVRIKAQLTQARQSAVPLMFYSFFGRDSADVGRTAVAGLGNDTDVVLIQDITSSFSDELSDAKVADKGLVDSLYAGGTGMSMMGIVVHTGWGKTLAPLQKVKGNSTFLGTTITNLNHCGTTNMPKCSGTDIASGLIEALKVFDDPNYKAANSGAEKVIVLVSDGEPNGDNGGSHPTMSDAQLLTLAQQTADQAWAKKIHVYVAFFNRANDQSAATKLATLKRGNGVFLQTTDAKKLPTLMAEIVKRLPKQLLY
jgi:predicted RecA/RadA family phage recombinase